MRRVSVYFLCCHLLVGAACLRLYTRALDPSGGECAQTFWSEMSPSLSHSLKPTQFLLQTRLTRLCSLLLQELLAAAVGDF